MTGNTDPESETENKDDADAQPDADKGGPAAARGEEQVGDDRREDGKRTDANERE